MVFLVDFGYSCFTIPETPGSIQTFEGGYGYDQLKHYKTHQACVNKSHDICMLILSLLLSDDNRKIDWLLKLGQDICAKYLSIMNTRFNAGNKSTEYIDGLKYIDGEIRENNDKLTLVVPDKKTFSGPYSLDNDDKIFHPWYIYEMFDIDIDMTPENVLERLGAEVAAGCAEKMGTGEMANLCHMALNLKF